MLLSYHHLFRERQQRTILLQQPMIIVMCMRCVPYLVSGSRRVPGGWRARYQQYNNYRIHHYCSILILASLWSLIIVPPRTKRWTCCDRIEAGTWGSSGCKQRFHLPPFEGDPYLARIVQKVHRVCVHTTYYIPRRRKLASLEHSLYPAPPHHRYTYILYACC